MSPFQRPYLIPANLFRYSYFDDDDDTDLVVPYVDMEWHNDAVDADEMQFLWNEYVYETGKRTSAYRLFFSSCSLTLCPCLSMIDPTKTNRYSWDSAGFPGMDQEANSISAASFGIGAAPNCWLPLVNVEDGYTDFDQAGVHRSKDPGAGAFTPYYNRRGFATTDIPAG